MSDYYLVTKGDDIYHHGILGQRWGVRRYQNADGSLTPEGRKRYGYESDGSVRRLSRSEKRQVRKEEKVRKTEEEQRKKEEAAARKAEIEKQRHDANKEKVLLEGNATQIKEYVNELSNKELQDAVNRVKWRNELSELSMKEVKSATKTIDSMMKKVDKFNSWSGTAIKTLQNTKSVIEIMSAIKEAKDLANKREAARRNSQRVA